MSRRSDAEPLRPLGRSADKASSAPVTITLGIPSAMNTGFAITLWVLMFWPLIAGIAYPILRKPRVPTVTAFTFASVVIGYGAMAGTLITKRVSFG